MDKLGFLGIDVSKGYADFILLNGDKQEVGKSFKCYDNAKGHKQLLNRIEQDKVRYDLTKIVCGVESTGGYENNWYNMLFHKSIEHGLEVYRLNPRGVKNLAASKLTRTITDRVSANLISQQMIDNHAKLSKTAKPSIEESEARRFYRMIQSKTKATTKMKNQLEKLVYSAFPELLTLVRKGLPKWVYRLLSDYEGRDKIIRKKLSTLLKIKGLTEQKAIKLQQKARESVGHESLFLIRSISRLAKSIIESEKQNAEDKIYLTANYTSDEVELLMTIRGIGAYTAIGVMMEIEDISRFDKANKMAAFFGVHPVYKVSGDGSSKPKMSKQGSKSYRAILYMGAQNTVLHSPYFKEIYAKHRSRGMGHNAALGVIMHKLTKVFYGMLKSNKPFDEKVDQANIKRSVELITNQKTEQKHEAIEQEFKEIIEAPVSNRSYRKVKAQLMSQTSKMEIKTRSTTELNQT